MNRGCDPSRDELGGDLHGEVRGDLHQRLLVARILWASLLAGEVAFAAIVIVLLANGNLAPQAPQSAGLFTVVAACMLVTCVPLGYFLRGQIYKRGWRGHVIEPPAYMSGNLVLWAMCEGVAMFGLTALLVTGGWAALGVAVVAAGVQVINYPNGKPLRPAYSLWERSSRS